MAFPAADSSMNSAGAGSFLIGVVEYDAVEAAEHVLKVEVELGVGLEAALEIGSQILLADDFAIRRAQDGRRLVR